jgi:hypothetical protein
MTMDLRHISALSICIGLLAACSEDAPPMQPAPPPDRNFTATVNDQPVVGGTTQFQCALNTLNDDAKPQILLTFNDDLGHTIQVGIERGDYEPGERAVLYGMATADGRAFGHPKDAKAALTLIETNEEKLIVSGRFSLHFDQTNAAPGIPDSGPLRIKDALFEQVDCEPSRRPRSSGAPTP